MRLKSYPSLPSSGDVVSQAYLRRTTQLRHKIIIDFSVFHPSLLNSVNFFVENGFMQFL